MDYGLLGLFFVAAVIAVAAYFAGPSKVLPLDELLVRLAGIQDDAQLTATQKLHLGEIAYKGFQSYWVSLTGTVQDIVHGSAVVMKTTSHDLPLVGIEFGHLGAEQVRAFTQGKAIKLRARLPPWEKYASVVGLPAAFREPKVFCDGRWHGVKSTYRVRDPNEPKTGEFQALTATGEFRAVKRTGEHAAAAKPIRSGEFPALPKGTTRTGEHTALPRADQKTRETPALPRTERTGEFGAFGKDNEKRKP